MFEKLIRHLSEKLKLPLLGKEAHLEMAHSERIFPSSSEIQDYKLSAVMLLIYPNKQNLPCVLLIERAVYDGHHSGQIALPGGKHEEQDVDYESTALREFIEETGANETPFIIGKLSDVHIPISKFIVKPFVAYLNERPNFLINQTEVVNLIEWDLQDLLQQNSIKKTTLTVNNTSITTPYYLVEGKILWGATAMIVNELKHLIKDPFIS
jgi:8-oxo-dGTP pyrophosphatase MutT (NUDIX family)